MEVKVSIIVRSFNRIFALNELLGVLLKQEFHSFEIIVVEQSTEFTKEEEEDLFEISKDPRVKILKRIPLGGPSARNEGVKNASGEILLFIDDDDIPVDNFWIQDHYKEYTDPKLIGFTGRHIVNGNYTCPYWDVLKWYNQWKCMSYNLLYFPQTFARLDISVKNVRWLHGTNASIRKEWVDKVGLWDEDIKNQDEHSFAFKLHPYLKNDFRLDFKNEPIINRRSDLPGGMGKRSFSLRREWKNQASYVRNTLYRYKSWTKILYPLHLLYLVYLVFKRYLYLRKVLLIK